MANEKMTKKMWYNEMAKIVAESNRSEEVKAEAQAFIEHEIELLERKRTSSDKAKEAKAEANKAVEADIMEALNTLGRAATITEILKATDAMAQYTNQKITYVINKMANVTRTVEKKRAYYSLAE